MYDFDDIRPYHDNEVRGVVDSLLRGQELSRALGRFTLPKLSNSFPGLVTHLVKARLRRQLRHVSNVHDVQIVIEKYLDRLIETTTTSLTHTGLDKLSSGRPYLFISNHRDIAMDPAFVNYMLYHQGFDTLQIAIGDNLLKKPFLSDLMRLNKSFIVKRSLQGREKLKASKQLSAYIHHCIDKGENVWIAQREGRAKDGNDRTEAAIIKMLHMADREAPAPVSLAQSMRSLHIVPVSISYELDPCDQAKARELHALETQGCYQKEEDADVKSILHGMIGSKGDVHVSFGRELEVRDDDTAESIARRIDEQVIGNYRLHLVNYLAMEMQQPDFMDFSALSATFKLSPALVVARRQALRARLEAMPAELRSYVIGMYAYPVRNQAELGELEPRA